MPQDIVTMIELQMKANRRNLTFVSKSRSRWRKKYQLPSVTGPETGPHSLDNADAQHRAHKIGGVALS